MSESWFGSDPFSNDAFGDIFNRFFGSSGSRPQVQRVDVNRLFSDDTKRLVSTAAQAAVEWGNAEITPEHLLYGATQVEPSRSIIEQTGLDPDTVASQMQAISGVDSGASASGDDSPGLSPASRQALRNAQQQAARANVGYVGPEHVLLGIAMLPSDIPAARLLKGGAGIDEGRKTEAAKPAQTDTPTLDEYGRDLTEEAREGNVDPVVGRNDEIEETIEILSRRRKNNPVLIGDPGVGKTAIVEGLAQRIVNGDVPSTLAGRRVIALDMSSMVAGAKYRGEFEERLTKVLDEVREHSDELVLFIDELHTIVGAGSGGEGSMDAGNMLKPALARGELHTIGATTIDEYRKYIEKDAALERRFQPVMISEPSVDDTIQILEGLADV
mgnify:CR=1 FL=1